MSDVNLSYGARYICASCEYSSQATIIAFSLSYKRLHDYYTKRILMIYSRRSKCCADLPTVKFYINAVLFLWRIPTDQGL